MELQTINQVSKAYDISPRMLRYYEQIGLIESQRKDDYAYRVYDEPAIRRLQQIIILRKLRIPMKHIAAILSQPEAAEAVEIFKENISELDDEISALSTVRRILMRLVDELQQRINIRLEIDSLLDSSVLSIVNSLSLSKNHIKETAKVEELSKANDALSKINDRDVRIVYLPPSAVASALCFDGDAESDTDKVMGQFVQDVDLFKVNPGAKFYGFNNPVFDENNNFVKQGYEVWATIPDDFDVPAPLTKKAFAGGLYAAYTSKPVDFGEWKHFVDWLNQSDDFERDEDRPYDSVSKMPGAPGCSGWGNLEEHINSYNFYGLKDRKHIPTHLDFLIPIKEKDGK
jgi:DNA-binding transcriptional MerR regulator